MNPIRCLAITLLALGILGAGRASANTCQAENLTCATGMPIDGYCECTSHGVTKGGTVIATAALHRSIHHPTAATCQANPQAAGCPHP